MLHKTFVPDSPAAAALLEWWGGLENRRGERAALRRAHSPDEVAITAEYHHAYRRHFAGQQVLSLEALPAVLGLLANVKTTGKQTLANAMSDDSKGRSAVSELRFRRLIHSGSQAELFADLRRVIGLLRGEVNLLELAELIHDWPKPWRREKLAKELAYAYYAKLKIKE